MNARLYTGEVWGGLTTKYRKESWCHDGLLHSARGPTGDLRKSTASEDSNKGKGS